MTELGHNLALAALSLPPFKNTSQKKCPIISHAASFDWNALLLPNTANLSPAQMLLLNSHSTLALYYNVYHFLQHAYVSLVNSLLKYQSRNSLNEESLTNYARWE